jgi:hypothetical protein
MRQSMNAETLERLIIDRNSGELTPEVEELLEAYLDGKPELAPEAEQMVETLRLAKLALAETRAPVLPLPEFKGEFPAFAPRTKQHQFVHRWIYGMAACFVGGVLLGLLVMPGRNSDQHPTAAIASQVVAPTTSTNSGFWSINRLRAAEATVVPRHRDQVVWKSPVRKPEILPQL